MKKLFIFSTVILLFSVASFLAYNFVLKKDNIGKISSEEKSAKISKTTEKENSVNEKKVKPIEAVGKIELLTNNPVLFPVIDETAKKIKYYDDDQKKGFWEISFDGSFKKKIINENFSSLNVVIWSPDKKQAVLKIAGDFYNYNYGEEPKKIKDSIKYLVWSNLGDKIIYKYFNSTAKNPTLNISNSDGSDWKKLADIEDIADNRIIIATVPQSSLVSFWVIPDAQKENTLNIVSIAGGGNIEKIVEGKFGADYLWSPKGEKFLVSSISEKGSDNMILEIGTLDDKGENLIDLKFPTLVSKCVWSKDSQLIYCALPSGIPENSVIPNDYNDKKFFTEDSFWKIDTETGKKERLVELEDINEKIDATNLFLSPNEDILFFINRRDGKLYRIVL